MNSFKTRRATGALIASLVLASVGGCAVERGQETVGAYVDDAAITATVKTRLMESREVSAGAIKVETLNGKVMLSGFATSENERQTAQRIARSVNGVRSVRNGIEVRN